MNRVDRPDSPLEAAAGAAGAVVVDAFELLGDETRLAILLALWESYDPHATDTAVSFTELFERVGTRDSGNFTYHLDRLTGHFVEATDDGYRLRNAGLEIVQAVIAGAGLEDRSLPPTEIARTCHRCGGPVEVTYEDEHLTQSCTECDGNIGPGSVHEVPPGTLMTHNFDPAGLVDRTPDEVYVDGSIEFIKTVELLQSGVCPQCSGQVDGWFQVCSDHAVPPRDLCPTCGTRDEVRVRYRCSVCKYGSSFPAEAAVQDHPAVVAFRHDLGITSTFDLTDPEACGRLWAHLMSWDHTLESTDPVRVGISVTEAGETLRLTLTEDLVVTAVTRTDD